MANKKARIKAVRILQPYFQERLYPDRIAIGKKDLPWVSRVLLILFGSVPGLIFILVKQQKFAVVLDGSELLIANLRTEGDVQKIELGKNASLTKRRLGGWRLFGEDIRIDFQDRHFQETDLYKTATEG